MKQFTFCLLVLIVSAIHLSAADPPIVAIAPAPDDETIVTGSNRGADVHVHSDLTLGGMFEIDFLNVHDLSFSPDGTSLAVAGGDPGVRGVVNIFSWPKKELIHRLERHTDVVFDVAWGADGTKLITGGLDKQVLLWDIAEERVERAFEGHSKGVTSVCPIESSQLLISAGLDQSLRVWNLSTGELVRTLDNHTAAVNDLRLRPATAGLPMVVSCGNDRTLRFWQPTIGRLVRFARLDAIPQAAVWIPGEPMAAVAMTDGRILIIDAETTEIVREFDIAKARLYTLAITQDGKTLLAGGRNGALNRLSLESD